MKASTKPSNPSKKSKPAKPNRTEGEGQLADEALDKVTGGATIPVKRKKKRVIWA